MIPAKERSPPKLEPEFWESLLKSGDEGELKYARDLPDDSPEFILKMLSEFEKEVLEFCFCEASGLVLDAGCGNGNILIRALRSKKKMQCIGMDFSRNMVYRAALRAKRDEGGFFLQGCINRLPLKKSILTGW